MHNRDLTKIVTLRRLPAAGALFFASTYATIHFQDAGSWEWLSGLSTIVMMISGVMFLIPAFYHAARPLEPYKQQIDGFFSGLREFAGVLAKFFGGLAAAVIAIIVGLFVLGGLVGLLLIGWKAVIS